MSSWTARIGVSTGGPLHPHHLSPRQYVLLSPSQTLLKLMRRADVVVIFPLRIPLPFFLTRLGRRLFQIIGLRARPSRNAAAIRNGEAREGTAIEKEKQKRADAGKPSRRCELGHGKEVVFPTGLTTAPVVGVLLLLARHVYPAALYDRGSSVRWCQAV